MSKQSIFPLLFFLSVVVFKYACTKNEMEGSSADFIEFGHFHGFCRGETCIEIFRLNANNIYEDTTDVYPSGTLNDNRKFMLLPPSKFELCKNLIDDFPLLLLEESKTVFGIPDAYDQGGYYLAYKKSGTHKVWLFDKNINEIPEYIHTFILDVGQKIQLLNE